ncbi:probable ATP-dependent RNA helicase Dbp73D [Trichogramma pretiosum]|uniref:probable ATP-dependent RNA helicase Dbp73D n=1 Tax=Trichogramma pretiosum TaxID=7493 RepID=UPI0006C9AC22|nr:probable ATP-dependent RNA helicase Dbp73D [Trichogramma pretiosum]
MSSGLFVSKNFEDEVSAEQDHLAVLRQQIAARAAEREKQQKEAKKNEVNEKDLNAPASKTQTDNNVKSIEENEGKQGEGKKAKVLSNFTILGKKQSTKQLKVKRVLQDWIAHPKVVNSELSKGESVDSFEPLLDSHLITKLKNDGFDKLFPIQATALKWLLDTHQHYRQGMRPRDTCISMPTGSGKTLSYVLPIIQILKNKFVRLVRCLIVLPTQELATQVYKVMTTYTKDTHLKVAVITGASSFDEEQEKLVKKEENGEYISKVDIVIATPGRLIDHIKKTEGFNLEALRFLVIDEADRTTDWLRYLPPLQVTPPQITVNNSFVGLNCKLPAQKILLSATLSLNPENLHDFCLHDPILYTSAAGDLSELDGDLNLDEDFTSCYGNPSELTERIFQSSQMQKPLAAYHLLLKKKAYKKALVFTNSCESAHSLALLLAFLGEEKKITVGELTAQLGSKQREQTLNKFKDGSLQVLVSSDALARGLDIPKIKLVISYDLPKHVKGYIHRAGRTGRGGVPGTAVSILLDNQIPHFSKMLRNVGKTVPEVETESLDELAESVGYKKHLEKLQEKLDLEDEEKKLSGKAVKRPKRN